MKDQLTFAFWEFFGTHRILTVYLIVVNLVTFVVYALDKRAAVRHRSRIRNNTLSGLAFLGGAIGAYAAMYTFRHKTRQKRFTVGVPLAFILHIVVLFLMMNAKKIW